MAFTDWLGQSIEVGDHVIYPAGSGRSITMIIGTVVGFNDNGSITLCPVKSSRWKQHHGRTRYVDNRTGKGIDPWSGSGKHIVEGGCHVRRSTGEEINDEDYYALQRSRGYRYDDYAYKPVVFKDYVERQDTPTTKVTVHVTENVTKWTGVLE